MAVSAIQSQGVVFKVGQEGSPTTYISIGNVTNFSGPGGQAAVIDITNLDSTAKEKLMGLPDEGQLTLTLNIDPDNNSHIKLRQHRAARTRVDFQIVLTDASPTTGTFFGYVLGYQLSGGVDAVVKLAITIEIDGPIAWA